MKRRTPSLCDIRVVKQRTGRLQIQEFTPSHGWVPAQDGATWWRVMPKFILRVQRLERAIATAFHGGAEGMTIEDVLDALAEQEDSEE